MPGCCARRILAKEVVAFPVLGRPYGARHTPRQLGQTFANTCSMHEAQNVHSQLQIRASVEFGSNILLQCSHVGLSSSMMFLYRTCLPD
jgi:hypothetical protein